MVKLSAKINILKVIEQAKFGVWRVKKLGVYARAMAIMELLES